MVLLNYTALTVYINILMFLLFCPGVDLVCTQCYRGRWRRDTLAPCTNRVTDRKPSLEFLSADGE